MPRQLNCQTNLAIVDRNKHGPLYWKEIKSHVSSIDKQIWLL